MPIRTALNSDRTATDDDMLVMIAGGGIAGLTLSLALARHGIASNIFERRERFEPEGAGIQIGPNGAHLLSLLGVDRDIKRIAGMPTAISVRDGTDGTIITNLPIGAGANRRHTAPYWTMHRADLHEALRAAVKRSPFIRLRQGADVLRGQATNDDVTLTCYDHSEHTGTVFVAADGLHSRFRKAKISDEPLRYLGKSAVRTVIPSGAMPDGVVVRDVGLWMAPNAHVVHYPVRTGSEVALVGVFDDDADANDSWSTPVCQSWVEDRSRDLAATLQDVLATGTDWYKWPLVDLPPLKRWTQDRFALIGDAAHPILPFLAQGAVMALEDGIIFADLLSQWRDNIPFALSAYEVARRRRIRRVQRMSQQMGRIYHQRGMNARLRNQAMRALGGKTLMRRYDWLYEWRPPGRG